MKRKNGKPIHKPTVSESDIAEAIKMARSIAIKRFRRVLSVMERHKRRDFRESIISEAYLAVSKAARKYCPNKSNGAKFTTFAHWVINSELRDFNKKLMRQKKNPNSEFGDVSFDLITANDNKDKNGSLVDDCNKEGKRQGFRLRERSGYKKFFSREDLKPDDTEHNRYLVERALSLLEGDQKKVVAMTLKGISIDNIASSLKVSSRTVRNNWDRAIDRLKESDTIKQLAEEEL